MATADQDAWLEVAHAVREQLRRLVPLMHAMTPEEVKTFVDAVNQALCLERGAQAFDHDVDLDLARLPFGGEER